MKTETIQEMAGMQDGAIVSKVLTQNGSTTLFALAQGEEIQEHTSTRAALAIVLEGRIIFTVGGSSSSGICCTCPACRHKQPYAADTEGRAVIWKKCFAFSARKR